MTSRRDYTFVCSACTESMVVNEPMRDALVKQGCVVCGAEVTEHDFEADYTKGQNAR